MNSYVSHCRWCKQQPRVTGVVRLGNYNTFLHIVGYRDIHTNKFARFMAVYYHVGCVGVRMC